MNKVFFLFVSILCVFSCSKPSEKNKQVQLGEISEVSFTDVHFNDEFRVPGMDVNRTVSIPSAFYQCEINGRFDNFALAGGLIEGEHQGDVSYRAPESWKMFHKAGDEWKVNK